ncbi:MAG: SRPBCC family protein [Chloroflexota bacterium]
MKYSTEVVIDLPRERVIELFDNTENMYKWQNGLKSHEFLKLMTWFLPGMFKKETLNQMNSFKSFAEGDPSLSKEVI